MCDLPGRLPLVVTGSGAQQVAENGELPYAQEVNALVHAVLALHPSARTVIELGGEDAKMVSIDVYGAGERNILPVMNEKCAAGTGSMLDRMLARLEMSPEEVATCRYSAGSHHPIAAKCGVFAETDIVGLLKNGVPREAILAALYDAIVQQNITTLAHGRTPLPQVLLLGGPHLYHPGLVRCWRYKLHELWERRGVVVGEAEPIIVPEFTVYLPAIGAVLAAKQRYGTVPPTATPEEALRRGMDAVVRKNPSRLAFASDREYRAFIRKYTPANSFATIVERRELRAHLGIDCGSTTVKAVLLDEHFQVLRKEFAFATPDPIQDVRGLLRRLIAGVHSSEAELNILSVGCTGYAKDMLAPLLKPDVSVVETIAHKEAATLYFPNADVVCDVGGQDIKIMLLRQGTVTDFRLNTQCSAGTGYFFQTVAERFGVGIEDFSRHALEAAYAPEFSAGCTIFLQSDIVNYMRTGYTAAEIMAGVTQVLPVNIWVYAARLFNLAEAGTEFVLQGGTQRNLAAVRAQVLHIEAAFEHCGRAPIIHVHPHPAEAGAIGTALLAANARRSSQASGWIGFEALEALRYSSEQSDATRCGRCDNRCARTFIHVIDYSQGNLGNEGPTLIVAPCEKGRQVASSHGLGMVSVRDAKTERDIPNFAARLERHVYSVSNIHSIMHDLGQALSTDTTSIPEGTRILFPRVLNHSLYAPTFIAWFLALGFGEEQLLLSPRSTRAMSSEAMARATIDPCFPAKIAFAHIEALLHEAACHEGKQWLFHPAILRIPADIDDAVDSMTCTVAAVMPEVVHAAFTMEGDTFRRNHAEFLRPFLSMENEESFAACMTGFFASRIHASDKDFRRAANTAWRVQAELMRRIQAEARDCLLRLEAESRLGVVMLGRPYHMDRALNHGVLDALHAMHVPIFTAETLPRDAETLRCVFGAEAPRCVRDVWPNPYSENSSRKIWAAKYVARHPNLIAVELSSFKCGHDAPTYSIVRDILAAAGKPLFSFLDLDENTPRSSLNIRVETIGHFLRKWCCERGVMLPACPEKEELCFVAS